MLLWHPPTFVHEYLCRQSIPNNSWRKKEQKTTISVQIKTDAALTEKQESKQRERWKSVLFLLGANINSEDKLAPSLSEPVQFLGWKMQGHTCAPVNTIFSSPLTHLLSMLCILMKILSHASVKKKTKRLTGLNFAPFLDNFMWHGSEGVLGKQSSNSTQTLDMQSSHPRDYICQCASVYPRWPPKCSAGGLLQQQQIKQRRGLVHGW